MPVTSVDHLGVVVTDLDAVCEFLREWLGATEVFRMERFDDPTGQSSARLGAPSGAGLALAMLEVSGCRVELVQWWPQQGQDPTPVATTPGMAHLGLTVEDLPEVLSKLEAMPGMHVVGQAIRFSEGPTPGLTNAFVQTPWGLLVELMDWTGSGGQGPVGDDLGS